MPPDELKSLMEEAINNYLRYSWEDKRHKSAKSFLLQDPEALYAYYQANPELFFMKEIVADEPKVDIRQMLLKLDSDEYEVREAATDGLIKVKSDINARLLAAMENTESLEVVSRLKHVLSERKVGNHGLNRGRNAARLLSLMADGIRNASMRKLLAEVAESSHNENLKSAARLHAKTVGEMAWNSWVIAQFHRVRNGDIKGARLAWEKEYPVMKSLGSNLSHHRDLMDFWMEQVEKDYTRMKELRERVDQDNADQTAWNALIGLSWQYGQAQRFLKNSPYRKAPEPIKKQVEVMLTNTRRLKQDQYDSLYAIEKGLKTSEGFYPKFLKAYRDQQLKSALSRIVGRKDKKKASQFKSELSWESTRWKESLFSQGDYVYLAQWDLLKSRKLPRNVQLDRNMSLVFDGTGTPIWTLPVNVPYQRYTFEASVWHYGYPLGALFSLPVGDKHLKVFFEENEDNIKEITVKLGKEEFKLEDAPNIRRSQWFHIRVMLTDKAGATHVSVFVADQLLKEMKVTDEMLDTLEKDHHRRVVLHEQRRRIFYRMPIVREEKVAQKTD